jgi:hypothetical protein
VRELRLASHAKVVRRSATREGGRPLPTLACLSSRNPWPLPRFEPADPQLIRGLTPSCVQRLLHFCFRCSANCGGNEGRRRQRIFETKQRRERSERKPPGRGRGRAARGVAFRRSWVTNSYKSERCSSRTIF